MLDWNMAPLSTKLSSAHHGPACLTDGWWRPAEGSAGPHALWPHGVLPVHLDPRLPSFSGCSPLTLLPVSQWRVFLPRSMHWWEVHPQWHACKDNIQMYTKKLLNNARERFIWFQTGHVLWPWVRGDIPGPDSSTTPRDCHDGSGLCTC